MSILKVVKGEDSMLVLYDRLNYIKRPTATSDHLIYGASVSSINTYSEMKRIKTVWNAENGKAFFHLILTPEPNEVVDTEKFYNCNVTIAEYLAHYDGWRQVLVAIHFDKFPALHSHFLINNIGIVDGKRWSISPQTLNELKKNINKILLQFDITAIRQGSTE